MDRWRIGVALCAGIFAASCRKAPEPDAYGNVEATSVVVAAEATGQLLTMAADDGVELAAGAVAATIDATPLDLQRQQIEAQKAATESRSAELAAQRGSLAAQQASLVAQRSALEAQREIAQRGYDRTQRLIADQAATAQQLDQAEREVRVLTAQIKAQDEQIAASGRQMAAVDAQQKTVAKQVHAADAQIAQVADRIGKTDVRNPLGGTVLVAYAKKGEIVQTGQPLYKIADLGAVDVRAYVTEPRLASVVVGHQAEVSVDVGGGRRTTLKGTVTWISSQAEFTPTPIQTRDERADLVYAFKIRVANPDRLLKIGMPVDVRLQEPAR
ncbi:MAG TPA: HlyD family efflux transporter periplasmic adaptor subunit [Vicinamibacterales bacterium]|jgi:HlyD family secretion protein|nr:HlyD family efflux transporter periplasmic adaptor subunit [Vicinamibacterales bacterium]